MVMALTIAVLVAGSVYLVLQRGMVRIVFGMSLFGHASNLTLLAAGVGSWRGEAFPSRVPFEDMGDPLPQAFVLTAIVIAGYSKMCLSPSALSTAGRNARLNTKKLEEIRAREISHVTNDDLKVKD